jgi:hypothetical protein
MMFATRLTAVLAGAMTVGMLGFGVASAQVAPSHRVEVTAALHGSQSFPHAAGTAKFESRASGRELNVSLSGVRSLAGRTLVVFVHGTRAGTMTVTNTGRAHLHRHGAPACRAGQPARIRTRAGTLVASGTFSAHH